MLKVLYQACEEGELGTVQFLLRMKGNNIDLSTAKFSEGGLTPLHVASKSGCQEVVKFILNKGASPMVVDEARNTPLHLAATYGHLEVAKDLLVHESQHNEEACESARSNLLQMVNTTGLSPFGCAVKAPEPHFQIAKEFLSEVYGNPANSIPDFSKSQLFPKFATVPLDKPANIVIVGDQEAGKSTLIKSLQEGRSRRLIGRIASRRVRDVDEHFGGVITTDFSDADFRRVLFHDLAGHTNYFHESLLEPNHSLKHTVFIVVVNLKFNPEKTKERLTYWLNFLYYHTSRLASEGTKPNVIVVGSHKDVKRGGWRSGEKFIEVYTDAIKERPHLHDRFNRLMNKPVALDCRRFEVSEARQLRSCLQKHCQNSLHQQQEALPPSMCYILSQVLLDSREFPPFLTLSELKDKITNLAGNPGLSLYKLLPTEPTKLMEICKILCEYGRLLIFDNPVSTSDLYSWIVHDIHALLTEIDRRLAILRKALSGSNEDVENANNVPQQEVGQSHFGIITREKLESVFSSSPRLSRKGSAPSAVKVSDIPVSSSSNSLSLNSNLAIELLLKYKYCEAIRNSGPASSNESFFFPGLLQEEEMGEPCPWEPGTNYGFAWCAVPHKEEDKVIEFFLPRFLKNLLLCFIQNYIIHHDDDDQDLFTDTSVSYETTAVWSRGVSWSTRDDVKVNIELKDNAIILSMYSQEGKELSCLQLRNKIMATIKNEKKKWQPDIEMNEFIIPFKGSFPVQTLDNHRDQMISLKSIEEAILKGEEKIDDSDIQSLLFFEPCIVLSRLEKSIQDQIQDPDHTLGPEGISDIFSELGDAFVQHFNLPKIRSIGTPQPHDSRGQSITTDSEDGQEAPVSPVIPHTSSSGRSSLAGSSVATDESSISSKKLLECMNSVSIFDTAEFLHKLENYDSTTPVSDSSELERDDVTQYDVKGGNRKDSTLKRDQSCTFVESSVSDFVFIESPHVLQCSNDGTTYKSKNHGIKLRFPPGAVAKGTLNVEMGVLLSGPFTFSANVKPISPILWLSVKENRSHKFSKLVSVTLPHFMEYNPTEDQSKFGFFSAPHNDSLTDEHFTFKEVGAEHCKFSPGSGTLTTKHCSFICIAYKEPEGIVNKSNYCLICVTPTNIVQPRFIMHLYLTFDLKTCIEILRSRFSESEFEITETKFKFAHQEKDITEQQHALTIQFNTHLQYGWTAGKLGIGKITASDIDFFRSGVGYLRHLEEDERHPPCFKVEVDGSTATKSDVLCISFKGALDELEFQKPLALMRKQHSGSLSIDEVHEPDFVPAATGLTRQLTSTSHHSRTSSTASARSVQGNVLDRHLDTLIKYLDMNEIRPVLRRYGALLPQESDKLIDLSSQPTSHSTHAIEKLVTKLGSKGSTGFFYFKKALEETTEAMGHQDILKELSEDPEFEAIIKEYQEK